MKASKKLSLNKLRIVKLTNMSLIQGGTQATAVNCEGDGTLRSYVPTQCRPAGGNGNGNGNDIALD